MYPPRRGGGGGDEKRRARLCASLVVKARGTEEVLGRAEEGQCYSCAYSVYALCLPFPVCSLVSQALEAVCWIPLLYGRQGVLAGDHCQLPPTIKSREAMRKGLGVTLFERLMRGSSGAKISQLLDTQFRMHAKIMQWSNVQFYHGDLKAHATVASRVLQVCSPRGRGDERVGADSVLKPNEIGTGRKETGTKETEDREKERSYDDTSGSESKIISLSSRTLSQGMEASDSLNTAPPFLWIDTAGISWLQEDMAAVEGTSSRCSQRGRDTGDVYHRSRSNGGEAALVIKYLESLLCRYTHLDPSDICVVTPYRKQVQLIRRLLNEAIRRKQEEADTVKQAPEGREYGSKARGSLAGTSVNTVDGFQGREGEVVVISLVRSNPWKEVGFLSDVRRLNVAVTRAKRHLVIIGDSETVAGGGREEKSFQEDLEEPECTSKREADAVGRSGEEESSGQAEPKESGRLFQPRARAVLESLYAYACDEGEVRSALEFVDVSDVPGRDSAEFEHAGRHASIRQEGGNQQRDRCRGVGSEPDQKRKEGWEAKEAREDNSRPSGGISRAAAKRKKKKEREGNTQRGSSLGEGRDYYDREASPSTVTMANLEQEEALEEKIRRVLLAFHGRQMKAKADSGSTRALSEYTFPPSLSAYERRIVHAVAQDLGLAHASMGDGDERRVVVSFPAAPGKDRSQWNAEGAQGRTEKAAGEEDFVSRGAAKPGSVEEPEKKETEETALGQSDNKVETPKEGASCQRETGAGSSVAGSSNTSRSSKSRNKNVSTVDEEDIDAFLDSIVKEDWTCHYPDGKCKASTKVLGRVCPFCRKRFCFSHSLPEIHGCGNAAAAHARNAFRENCFRERRKDEEEEARKRGGGSVSTSKSLAGNSWGRSLAQQRLRGKLEEEKRKRTAQRKEKK